LPLSNSAYRRIRLIVLDVPNLPSPCNLFGALCVLLPSIAAQSSRFALQSEFLMDNLLSYFTILGDLSLQSGAIVRRYYNSQFEVEYKGDDSPVTLADREVEMFLREGLEKQFPDYSILGEEFGETKRSSAYRWIIDPIDGTKSFVMRTPLFGTMIALERDGLPVLGSIYLPIQDQLLIGSAETGTFLNGERCSVSRTNDLSRATMIVTDPLTLIDPEYQGPIGRLSRKVRLVRGFGDCYGYFLVACGLADVMIEPSGLKYYDVAPMPPILHGAGGTFTTFKGEQDLGSGQGLATNSFLHDQILQVLSEEDT
jgi:histidinol phosphatase-like enzyme (inositol monophosphatase family)